MLITTIITLLLDFITIAGLVAVATGARIW